ncbi:MAG: AraC family transcriptional regulator [Lachnospiraceae bacterium]|nr:AraC family transcriptional regulator [Lachnospiraceae bacterium]
MYHRKILVDETMRELTAHGTNEFPVIVNHDDLWMFEGKRVPIHWHTDLEFCLPKNGTALYQIYQQTYKIQPGQALLINSNVPHSCDSPSGGRVSCSSIIVRPDFLYGEFGSDIERNCFRPFLNHPDLPCVCLSQAMPEAEEIIQMLQRVDELFYQRPFCFELKIKALLCEVFSRILISQHAVSPKTHSETKINLERLEVMLYYIHTHFDSAISLPDLAAQVHLSREVCCRLFRKMTGRTFTCYLQEYRVSKSIPLIQSGQYSISEIAAMTGFSNASRFAQAFHAQIGCNPSEYRTHSQTNLL